MIAMIVMITMMSGTDVAHQLGPKKYSSAY